MLLFVAAGSLATLTTPWLTIVFLVPTIPGSTLSDQIKEIARAQHPRQTRLLHQGGESLTNVGNRKDEEDFT